MKKIMKNTFIWFSALSIFLLLSTVNSYAQEQNQQGQMRERFNRSEDFTKTLNLTPEQQAQIKQQRGANKEKVMQLRQQLRAKRSELKEELDKPSVDMNKINSIVAETKTLMAEQLDLRVKGILAMKQVLTPEQFKKLHERREKNKPQEHGQEHQEH